MIASQSWSIFVLSSLRRTSRPPLSTISASYSSTVSFRDRVPWLDNSSTILPASAIAWLSPVCVVSFLKTS